MMIKKYWLAVFLLFFMVLHAQNNAIKDASGTLLPAVQEFCPGQRFALSANIAGESAGGYTVSIVNGNLTPGSTQLTFANNSGNNHFSNVQNFPGNFNFSLYGKTYTKYVVGANGRILLGNGTDLDSLPGLTDAPPGIQIPSTVYQNFSGNNLPLAQIFFGYSPRNYSQNSDYLKILKNEAITYNGHAVLAISIIHTNLLNDSSYSKVSDAIVYLVSGTNEILIQYYETSSDNAFISGPIQNNSVLGIQNDAADKAKWPSEGTDPNADAPNSPYRYGQWANTQNIYKFTPSLKNVTGIEWFDNGTSIGTGANITYTPSDGHILKVVFTFDDGTTDATNSVTFKNYSKPTVSSAPGTTCGSGTTLTITNPKPGYTYSWKSGDPAFTATGTSITAPKTGNYYAVPNGCDAQKSDSVAVTISSPITPPSFPDTIPPVCDNLGQTSAAINLLQLVNYTPDAGSTVIFTDTAGNTIADAANNYTVNINSGTTLNAVMKINSTAVVCPISKAFSVSYLSFPAAQFPLTTPKLCFGTNSYSVAKFKTDFPQYAGFDLSFSTDNANFGLNSVNPSQSNPIYVKLSKSGFTCNSVATLNFDFYPEVIANDPVIPAAELQQCASSTQFFDLPHLAETYINNSGNVDFKFYTSLADAQNGTNPIPNPQYRSGKGDTTIFVVVSDKITGCKAMNIPSFTITVYNKPALLSTLQTTFTHCHENPIFALPTAVSDYVSLDPKVAASIKFFDANNNEISAAQFANYDASLLGNTPYAAISYNSTCGATVQFSLNFYPKPALSATQIPVCGQSSYSLQDFENFITNNAASGYSFTDENGNPLPASFDVKSSLPTVKVVITDKNTGCKSDVQTVNFVVGSPTPVISNATQLPAQCIDPTFATFDLTKAESQIFSGAAAFVFYDSAGNVIANPQVFKADVSQIINGTVASGTNCPTPFTVKLTVNTPTAIQYSANTDLCYGDGLQIFINNFSDFVKVDLKSPNGTVSLSSNSYTIPYADVLMGQTYQIFGTNSNGCQTIISFTPNDSKQPKISQINQSDSQIEVIASGGTAPLSYYFNGALNTGGNILTNPTADSYEIYAVSADGCRGPSEFLYNIIVKNVITPNGDGYNDVWTVRNLGKMQNVALDIYDRYGKKVYSFASAGSNTNSTDPAWDGSYNGRILPTASYWYVAKWHDPATRKDETKTGWILLKNRD